MEWNGRLNSAETSSPAGKNGRYLRQRRRLPKWRKPGRRLLAAAGAGGGKAEWPGCLLVAAAAAAGGGCGGAAVRLLEEGLHVDGRHHGCHCGDLPISIRKLLLVTYWFAGSDAETIFIRYRFRPETWMRRGGSALLRCWRRSRRCRRRRRRRRPPRAASPAPYQPGRSEQIAREAGFVSHPVHEWMNPDKLTCIV